MLNVTDGFHKAFQKSRRDILAIVNMNGVIYDKKQIKSIQYSAGAFGGDSFKIGSVQASTVKIVFAEIIEGIKELDEIKIDVGIIVRGTGLAINADNVSKVGSARVGRARITSYVPDRDEVVPLGKFYVNGRVDPNRNDGTTTVEAMDGFIFMEGNYKSSLSYPARLSDVAIEIASNSGMEVDPVSFTHFSNYRINEPTGYTYRQAIGIIAQYEAGFACFDRNGRLAIRQLCDPRYTIGTNDYFQSGFKKSELMVQVKGITCKVIQKEENNSTTTVLQAGDPAGTQIEIENNSMTQPLLNQLFTKVNNLNFYPLSLNWRGNPALEAGDWVTMYDRLGKKFKSPILNYSITFDGGISSTFSADTKASSPAVVAFRGPIQQRFDDLDVRVDAAGKNNVYTGVDTPKNPKENDIWFKSNGPDDEIWIYTQISQGVYDWVMQTSTTMDQDIKDKIENSTPADEIVKTINLSPEMDGKDWLKIKGAKIWLTKETKIDKAVITSAMIESVDAGSINTGTFDAARANIINLNAKSISAGIAKGKNLSINFDTGQVFFQRGKITSSTEGINIDLDKSLMYFKGYNNYSSALSKNGFVIYNGEPKTVDFEVYDSNIQAAFGSFRGVPEIGAALIGNHGIEVAGYGRVIYGNNPIAYTTKGVLSIKEDGSVFLASYGSKSLQIGLLDNDLAIMPRKVYVNGTMTVASINVQGNKNAIHVTRDGVRATPAYETAESYLGDIGRSYTKENCETWVHIDSLFSDVVNLDIPYEVFLQVYDNAQVWVSDFKSDAFLVRSDKPNIRFAWELKAKRRGFEDERLVNQNYDNTRIEKEWKGDKEDDGS